MIRKIFLAILVLGTGVGLYYGYLYFNQLKTPVANPLDLVPTNAALVLEGDNAQAVWNKLHGTNIIWEELCNIQAIAGIDSLAHLVDSIIAGSEQLLEFTTNNSTVISAHITGGNTFNYLFSAAIPAGITDEEATQLITTQFNAVKNQPFNGVPIHVAQIGSKNLQILIQNGIVALTYSRVLIEDVVHHIETGKNLITDKHYSVVTEYSGEDAEVTMYINFKFLPSLLTQYLSPEARQVVQPFVQFANSATFDVTLQSNAVMLNGFTYSADSALNYLNILKQQQPIETRVFELLPENTSFFMQYRLSDPQQFIMDYRMHLADVGNLQKYESDMAQLNSECGCNLATYLVTWLGSEITVAITDEGNEDHRYALFKTENPGSALERLNDLALLISEKRNEPPFHYWMGDYVVGQIPIDSLHSKLFGHAFSGLASPYYMRYEDYIIFAGSISALNDIIHKHSIDRTLLHSQSFNAFYENLSSTASIFVYSNTARSPDIYKQFIAEDWVSAIDSNVATFKQFEAVAIQVSHYKDELFLTNAYLKHNPVYKEVSSTLWEVALDSAIATKPTIVHNHNTGAKEIVIQDSANVLYLISNTGKVEWKYQLDGQIMGEVKQIDAYKNNKLQLLLNTASTLYVIDRLGRDLEGYPVSLPAMASAQVGIIDYEKTKDYRLMVPCANGMVYSYETFGKPIDGWAFAGAGAPVVTSPQHFNLQGKDYIFFLNANNEPFITDRKGGIRHTVQGQITGVAANTSINLEIGKNIDETRLVYTDTAGMVVKHRFNGDVSKVAFLPFSTAHTFVFEDVDGDGIKDYIFTDSTSVWVFGADEQMKFELQFTENIGSDIQTMLGMVGIQMARTGEVLLFDLDGILQGEMPFAGHTAMGVADINNDGTINVVVGSAGKILYTYNLK